MGRIADQERKRNDISLEENGRGEGAVEQKGERVQGDVELDRIVDGLDVNA